MCGLAGIIINSKSGFIAKELKAFEELLYVDAYEVVMPQVLL